MQVIGVDPIAYPEVAGLVFIEGDANESYAALGEGDMVINAIFAAQAGVSPGDVITLTTPEGPQTYHVAGVAMDYLNAKAATVYLSHDALAQDFNITNDLLLLVNHTPDASVATLEADVLTLLEAYPAFGLLSFERLRESQEQNLAAGQMGLSMLLVLLTIPSLLALANTLSINVIERTREIGMMRAVGATRKQIRRMIIAESLLLAALGVAFGILAGLWISYVMVGALELAFMPVPYGFPYDSLLLATAVGLLLGVVAATIPARRASNLEIVRALAYE